MPEDTIATLPTGKQTTWGNPLGPQPVEREHAKKFHKAFAELTQADIQKQEPPAQPAKTEQEPASEPAKEPTKETTVETKPESPLDAVLGKTVKKEEKVVEEPDVLKEFDEKTANWQRAREVMKTQSTDLKTLRKELEALKVAPKAEPTVIEALTKERDDLRNKFQQQEERLKSVNAEYSEEFQGLLADREGILKKISSRTTSYGGDAKGLIDALNLPDGKFKTQQIKEALAEIDPEDKPRIHALIESLDTHDEKIRDFRADLPRRWDEIQSKREVQLAEQSQAAIKQLETEFGKVAESLPNGTATLRELPDNDEWNQEIRSARETALRILKPNGADFNESASIAIKGARYDSLEKRLLALHADYKDLQAKYNEAVGAGPDFKGGSKPAPEKTDGKYKRGSFQENLAAIRAGQQGEM